MTIHINNPELEKHLKEYAKETGQPVELLANSFLEQAFCLYKNNPSHTEETLSRWNDYEKTGESVGNEKAKQNLRSWGGSD